MNLFKDLNGKESSKRFWGATIILIGLIMAVLTFWFTGSETLILGLIGAGVTLLFGTVFEKKKSLIKGNPPEDHEEPTPG